MKNAFKVYFFIYLFIYYYDILAFGLLFLPALACDSFYTDTVAFVEKKKKKRSVVG